MTAAWLTAIDHFAIAQREGGISSETIERRVRHMTAFAHDTDLLMDAVVLEDVVRWLLSNDVKPSTAASMKDSARAFFRWAHRTGRIGADPMGETGRMKPLLAPDAWEVEIRAWERALRGAGRTAGTVKIQGHRLRAFARDNARYGPWEMTPDMILDWYGTKRWGRDTRRGVRSALRGFYGWAKETKRTKKDPARKLPVMQSQHHAPRPAADQDLAFALGFADDRERLALWIASDLGLRCAEIAGLHSSDLRERDGKWSLRVFGKGQKERIVPVPESLAHAIHSRGSGFIFPGNYDGHISPHYLGKRVNALLPAGVTMHQLRHRFATIAYNVDRDTFTVQRLMGHASPATTQIYVALSDDTLRGTIEAVHRHRGGFTGVPPAIPAIRTEESGQHVE